MKKTIKKKAYIAGPISGRSLIEVTGQFGSVQKVLEHRGYEAINPLALQPNFRSSWKAYMLNCIPALITADIVYMLPGWEQSKGATLEHHIATQLGIEIVVLGKNGKENG